MPAFNVSQITQELTNRSIADLLDGPFIEASCFQFHDFCLSPYDVDAKRPDQPDRAALHKSLDVVAADEWDVFTEALAESFDQAGTVLGLLALHFLKYSGGGGVHFAQTIGEVAIDATVFLLQCNSQRQNLPFRKILEALGHGVPS